MDFTQLQTLLRPTDEIRFGKGASARAIADAERSLGITIRGDYRRFLETYGWARLRFSELYGLGEDVPRHLHLTEMTQSERTEMMPRLPSSLLPLMNDGGGNHYCLDLASAGPAVVFWDHEAGEEQEPSLEAPDFSSWLGERLKTNF